MMRCESAAMRAARREAYQARHGFEPRAVAIDYQRIENLIMLVEGALLPPRRASVGVNRELEAARRIVREMGRHARHGGG